MAAAAFSSSFGQGERLMARRNEEPLVIEGGGRDSSAEWLSTMMWRTDFSSTRIASRIPNKGASTKMTLSPAWLMM